MGLTTLLDILLATIPLVFCLPHPPVGHLVRRNRCPTQWYYRHGPSIRYLFRQEEPDATPAVGSPGAFRSTPFSVFIDKYYALQNGPPNGPRHVLTRISLHNDFIVRGHCQHPHFWYQPNPGDQGPSGSEICTSTYQCRGEDEIWDALDVVIGLSVN